MAVVRVSNEKKGKTEKIRREIKEFISFCVYEEGSNLLVRSESSLNKMCFLFENRWVAIHQVSKRSKFLLVKKSNRDFRLEMAYKLIPS